MADTPSWTLIGQEEGAAATATAAPELPGYLVPYSQAELLALLERLLPEHYLEPLKSPGPGYEVLQAAAAAGARLSQAVAKYAQAAFILSAQPGALASGTVELYRAAPHPEAISVVVKAGTVVRSSRGGREYLTTGDATFGPADLGPFTVGVVAIATGYEWNEPGPVTRASGEVLPGEIDTVDTLVEDPEVGDTSIQVRQFTATSGGVDASLDLHGLDRNLPRTPGETTATYRARVRTLPDNISPNAVERAAQRALYPLNAAFEFIETFELSYQTCYDGPSVGIAGSAYNATLFCFDDPRPATPFRNRWLDTNDMRGAIILVVENLPPMVDTSMSYGPDIAGFTVTEINPGVGASVDAVSAFGEVLISGLTGMTAASAGHYLTLSGSGLSQNDGQFFILEFVDPTSVILLNPLASAPDPSNGFIFFSEGVRDVEEADAASLTSRLGARALCAYDVPSTVAFGYVQGAYDGVDVPRQAIYKNLFDTLQSIKAAGVSAIIELRGQ